MPPHGGLAAGHLSAYGIPADGRTCRCQLHPMPYGRHVRSDPLDLLLLSYGGLSAGARSCGAGVPSHVRAMSQRGGLAAGHLSAYGVPVDGGAHRTGLHAVPYGRHVWPDSVELLLLSYDELSGRRRTMRRWRSRTVANNATQRRRGCRAPFATRDSSSQGDTAVYAARHVIPAAHWGRFPRPATLATRRTINAAPNHAAQAFPHTCEQCHSTAAWLPATISIRRSRLTAGHAGLACTRCHTGGTFGPIPSTCYSCHTTNYQAAPDHATLAFSHGCEQCHTTTAWRPSTYHHTRFALTGGHTGLRCSQCHTGTLGPVPSNCYSCHTTDYQRGPDHAAQAFPHTCEQCHSTAAWLPATSQHTSFLLTAGHAGLACTRCHTGGTFGPIPSTCYSCHTTNYQAAPDHATLAFSHSCEQCHTTTAWLPSTFRHTGVRSHGGTRRSTLLAVPHRRHPRADSLKLLLLSYDRLSTGARPCGAGVPSHL